MKTALASIGRAAVFSAAALVVSQAGAAVIFDGGAPNQVTAFYADTRYAYSAAAEDFVLAAGASTVTDAHWWGACDSPNGCSDGNFTLFFYADAGGSPGALIEQRSVGNAGQTATGNLVADLFPEYSYSAVFAPVVLIAGTTYWFAISNSPDTGALWGWESTAGTGTHAQYYSPNGQWESVGGNLAFNLTGSIPEPATVSLLGLALAGLAAARRRKM